VPGHLAAAAVRQAPGRSLGGSGSARGDVCDADTAGVRPPRGESCGGFGRSFVGRSGGEGAEPRLGGKAPGVHAGAVGSGGAGGGRTAGVLLVPGGAPLGRSARAHDCGVAMVGGAGEGAGRGPGRAWRGGARGG